MEIKTSNISKLLIILTLCFYFGNNNVSILKSQILLYYIPVILLTIKNAFVVIKCGKLQITNFAHIKWYGIFTIYVILSLIWAINRSRAYSVILRMLIDFLFITNICIYVKDKKSLNDVIKAYCIALIYMFIILVIYEKNYDYYGITIGFNRNLLSISYAYAMLLYYYIYKNENKKIYLLGIPISLLNVYLSASRKGILLAILLAVGTLVLSIGKYKKKLFKNLLGIIVIVIAVITIMSVNESLNTRIRALIGSFVGNETTDKSVIERDYYKDIAKKLFISKPIFGYGVNGFSSYIESIGYNHVAYSHSNWFELLSTLGIVGFILYYIRYLQIFNLAIKKYNSNYIETIIALIGIALLFVLEYGFVSYFEMNIQVLIVIFSLILIFYKNAGENTNEENN